MVLGLLAAAVTLPAPHNDAQASSTTLSGVYIGGGNVSGAASFGTWRGRPVKSVTDFVPGSTWSTIAAPTWLADQWKGRGILVSWAVPMLPSSGGSMATGAAGGYNTYFTQLAQTLVSRGLGNSVIRLGWEMNGNWYKWSAVPSPSTYIAYWRQVVTAMRKVTGQSFKFDWSPNSSYGVYGFNVASAYPGDAYVDIVGNSTYDQSWTYSPTQATQRWNEILNGAYGLAWLASFAGSHGKPVGLAEWGLSKRCDGHGGNDDPYYIQQMNSYIATHNVFYENYFERDQNSCELHAETTGTFPNGAASYRKLWAATTSTTTTTTTAAPDVRVSWYANRSSSSPLSGMKVNSQVFVFVNVTGASQVSFYLDDPNRTKAPRHVESSAPWDLVGGDATTALPFDTSTLAAGTHSLTVAVTTSSGTVVKSVSFSK